MVSYANQQQEKLSPFTKRILIVDDDPDITLTFKKGLEAENEYSSSKIFFQVYAYDDPLLALAEFKRNFYDLLLVDVNMSKMDGFELYHEIRKKDKNSKVCFLTASELYYEEFRIKGYNALDRNLFLRKPIDNDELIKEINKMIKNEYRIEKSPLS